MKYVITIILFVLLGSCIKSNDKTTKEIAEKAQTKYRNYDFHVSVNVQHLQFAPDFNYKYLINLKWERDAKNNLIFYKVSPNGYIEL